MSNGRTGGMLFRSIEENFGVANLRKKGCEIKDPGIKSVSRDSDSVEEIRTIGTRTEFLVLRSLSFNVVCKTREAGDEEWLEKTDMASTSTWIPRGKQMGGTWYALQHFGPSVFIPRKTTTFKGSRRF